MLALARFALAVVLSAPALLAASQTPPPTDKTPAEEADSQDSDQAASLEQATISEADVVASLADLRKKSAHLKSENEALRERLRELETGLGVKPVDD